MSNASILGASYNGNGNEEIGWNGILTCPGSCYWGYEGAFAFNHMYRAGLYKYAFGSGLTGAVAVVTNPVSEVVSSDIAGTKAVYDFGSDNKGYNTLSLGGLPADGSFAVQSSVCCSPEIVTALDTKYDDGNGHTGKILGGPTSAISSSSGCTNGSGKYSSTGAGCKPSYLFNDSMP